MRKILNVFLIITIMIFSSFFFAACNNDSDYIPNLTKIFTANGFEIQTTNDFMLEYTHEGIKLKSEGDNQISFSNTYLYGQYDMGNNFYDFENVSLEKYVSDIAKIERLNLSTPIKNITMTEKLSEVFSGNLNMNMYIIDEMNNPNGNWDYYTILCIGKGSNAFVYFNIYTAIQDSYYDENMEKFSSILTSVVFNTPTANSYNDLAKSYMSSTIVKTEDVMDYWNFNFSVPNDYIAYENPGYKVGNYLATTYSLEEYWSSSIRCSNLASFVGNAILDDDGVKHLIKFSTNNYLGFYTKTVESETSATYNVYYLDVNNNLSIYYVIIAVDFSNDLNSLGFGNYFEEQMIFWMQNIEMI